MRKLRVIAYLGVFLAFSAIASDAKTQPTSGPATNPATVPLEKYIALRLERDRLAEKLATALSELETAKKEVEAYKEQVRAIMQATTRPAAEK